MRRSRLFWIAVLGFAVYWLTKDVIAADHSELPERHSPSRAHERSAHPNIIFILTDDMALHDVEFMPRLKKLLVDEGTTFSNYFVTNSQCCPSRSSILRGQYVHNHGVESNSGGCCRESRPLMRKISTYR